MYNQYHTISRYIATWLLLQNSHFIHLVMECCMMFCCVGAGNYDECIIADSLAYTNCVLSGSCCSSMARTFAP